MTPPFIQALGIVLGILGAMYLVFGPGPSVPSEDEFMAPDATTMPDSAPESMPQTVPDAQPNVELPEEHSGH
jgi:hypothetical protein